MRPSVACRLVRDRDLGPAVRRMRLEGRRSLVRRVVGAVGWGEGHSLVVVVGRVAVGYREVGRRVAGCMEVVVKEHGSQQGAVEGERHSSLAAAAGSGLAGEDPEEHRRGVEGMEAVGSPVEEERLAEGREEEERMHRREVLEKPSQRCSVLPSVDVPRSSR